MRKLCQGHGKPKRGPYPNPMRERVDCGFMDEAAREKSLLRHSWYRNMKAREAIHTHPSDPPTT